MSRASHYSFFAGMSLAIDIVLLLPFLLAAVLIVAFLLGASPAGAAEGPKELIAASQLQAQGATAQPNGTQDLDSLGDNAEIERMRVQQNLERRSKAAETTSNMLKKHSDTQQAIIQNIK